MYITVARLRLVCVPTDFMEKLSYHLSLASTFIRIVIEYDLNPLYLCISSWLISVTNFSLSLLVYKHIVSLVTETLLC